MELGDANPYHLDLSILIDKLSIKAQSMVKTDLLTMFKPSFTTTTLLDVGISQIVFLGAVKKYFDYECFPDCGIPQIILKGTIEDW